MQKNLNIAQLKILTIYYTAPKFAISFPNNIWKENIKELEDAGLIICLESRLAITSVIYWYAITDQGRLYIDTILNCSKETLDCLKDAGKKD